jgi:hypothetical protein
MNATHRRSPVSDLRGYFPDRLGSVRGALRKLESERKTAQKKHREERARRCMFKLAVRFDGAARWVGRGRVCVTG